MATKGILIRVDPLLHRAIKKAAHMHEKTMADYIRDILRDSCKKYLVTEWMDKVILR